MDKIYFLPAERLKRDCARVRSDIEVLIELQMKQLHLTEQLISSFLPVTAREAFEEAHALLAQQLSEARARAAAIL